jgi:hypothetical protein
MRRDQRLLHVLGEAVPVRLSDNLATRPPARFGDVLLMDFSMPVSGQVVCHGDSLVGLCANE